MRELDDARMLAGIRIHETLEASGDGIDLKLLSDQLSVIAKELRRGIPDKTKTEPQNLRSFVEPAQSELASDQSDGLLGSPDPEQIRAGYAEAARAIYANRRRRTALFGNPELFGEPAWDILLDLYIAQADGKSVSVSSACIGSASPPTTGLRWLGVLAENSLILREHDPEDQRRVLVRLSDRGLAAMDEYFNTTAG